MLAAGGGHDDRMPLLTLDTKLRPCPIPLLHADDVPHPERALARGDLVRVRAGVYAPRDLWHALPPWERYLVRVHAVVLRHPGVVLCHESAVCVDGGPVFGDPLVVHVLSTSVTASRLVSGIRTHTTTDDRQLIEIDGVAMTAPAETAVDLARARHPAIGLSVADAMLRQHPELSRDGLEALNESRSSRRGRKIARWPLSRATALAETALESVSRAAIEWLGYPAPELQVTFASAGEEDRSDFLWREASLAGEADGDLKFDGRFGDPRVILRRQRDRDARLRGHVRAVAHWGWSEATAFAPLRDILHGIGLRTTGPENAAALLSLRRSLAGHAPRRIEVGDAAR